LSGSFCSFSSNFTLVAMNLILVILGVGTVAALMVFVFALWFIDAVEQSEVVLKYRPVLGSFLILLGASACGFVVVMDYLIAYYHTFYMVGFGMTMVFGVELILMGIFFCKSPHGQRKIIAKLSE